MDAQSAGQPGWMTQDPFAGLSVPAALQDTLQRHREHLARLIVSLQSAGVSETQIEASVSAIVSSYKEELMEAIKIMVTM